MKGIMNIMTQMMKKKEKMFKKNNFKISRGNPNNPEFNLFKFLGEIILHISKLCKKLL